MTGASGPWWAQIVATALALLLVLGLAWGVLRGLRRLQPGLGTRGAALPQVLHSVGLGTRERLVLVRHRGREYLLGVGAGSVQVIDRWAEAPGPEDPPAP
jgi:flagellar protein FliO/FliZ